MAGKISDDPDKVVAGTEKVAAAAGSSNYGILISSIATYLRSLTETLTNKTINAASNTISNLTTSMFAANVVDNDGSLAANSSTRLPTQAAVKAAIDGLLNANNAEQFKGSIDCSANPNYPAAESGYVYRVSVAGKIGGASGVNVEVGDRLQCIVDGSASGNHATVGANWWITQANIDGAVVGPASSTDNAIARFNGTSGKLIKNGAAIALGSEVSGALPVANGGTGVTAVPVFAVRRSADQSINTSTLTKVQWDTEITDSNSNFDSSTNYRFQPTVAGTYLVHSRLVYGTGASPMVAGNNIQAYIYMNGSPLYGNSTYAGGQSDVVDISQMIAMNGTTDYLEIYAYHENGAARPLRGSGYSSFMGFRVGA